LSPRGAIRGGLFVCRFTDRTAAATSRRHILPRRLSVVSAPPSEPVETSTKLAGARERAGPAARRKPAPPAAPLVRDKVRAPKIAALRGLPHIHSVACAVRRGPINEVYMTAYLISLALAGLIALALSEAA